ncbi:MAG: winged helix-turn-helix domain-containing protein [Candidatus Poribacteria bacterium]|nr:winged helix-turn-helix domain-containing protein [Candidatus Poribacteria bacterium]
MLDNIGNVAGAIWQYLEINNEVSVTKLTRDIGENQRTVLMGVGWLAREGKLNFEQRKQGIYITLKTQQLNAEVA